MKDLAARWMTRSGSTFVVASLAALGISCTGLPPPQEWLQRRTPRGAAPRLPPSSDLRPTVRSLTWQEAVRLARQNSPTVAAAADRIRRSEALLRAARALAYPRLDARGAYVRFIEAADFRGRTGSDVSGTGTRTRFVTGAGSDIYSAGLDAAYPLFDGGEAYYAREAAASALDASMHGADAVRQNLEQSVSTAFLNVLLAAGVVRIAEDALDFTRGQEEQARAREEAGEGLKVDTLRFTTRASEELLALNKAKAEREVQLAVLAELMAVSLSDDVEIIKPEAGLEIPEGDLVGRALERRPEIQSLRARIAEAESALSREKANWWPTVSVFGSYGFITLDTLKLSHENDELQVGGSLSMNLFEGGATAARTAALRHELAELQDQTRGLVLAVEREVHQSRIDLEVARTNMEVSQETVALAEEVLERVTARYRAGEAQLLDVTEADLGRTRAQLALLRSRVNLLLAQSQLRRAVGLGVFEISPRRGAEGDARPDPG